MLSCVSVMRVHIFNDQSKIQRGFQFIFHLEEFIFTCLLIGSTFLFFILDLETARKLELVVSQNAGNLCPENTLYGVLNKCCTLSGQRRLRSLVLQPSIDEEQINKRLDCVEELVNNQTLFISIKVFYVRLQFSLFIQSC